MASWSKSTKHEPSEINNGNQYTRDSLVATEHLNSITENAFYAVDKADEALEKANSAFENNGTVVRIGGSAVANLSFSSDPQTQLDNKLDKSGGTVGSITFTKVGTGFTFITKDNVQYFIYGDGVNYSRLYLQIKDKDGNNQWYPLLDENGKLYSNKNEVANNNLSNVTYPEIVYNASTDKFDGLTHTGAGDRVVERYVSSDGFTWYEIYESGWKRCGSTIDTKDANIIFPLPSGFSNTNYTLIGVGILVEGFMQQEVIKRTDGFQTASRERLIHTNGYIAEGY